MRVTANTFPTSLTDQLNRLNQRQTQLHQQASTGQRIRNPSDDPAAVHRVMDLQHSAKAIGQYQRNIGQLQDQAKLSFATTNSVKKLLDRAQELMTRAGGLRSQSELNIYAEEVNELIKTGVQTANASFRGGYALSGTKNDLPPFVAATDANGKVTSVTYQGNAEVPSVEISQGVTLSAGLPGANTTGSGARGLITDSRNGADLFNHLIGLRDALLAGDQTAIAGTIKTQMSADEENFLIHVGINGALQSQLEAARKLADYDQDAIESAVSQEADIDLAQTLVELNQTQTAYQAALQSGSQILSQTLLDYLR